MNLRTYLFFKEMTVRDFCKVADFSEAFICTVLSGRKKPSAKTLRMIERATNGIVKAHEVCAPIKLPPELEEQEGGKAA